MPSKVSILTVAGQPGSQFLQPTTSWTAEEAASQQNLRQGQQQLRYPEKGGAGPALAHPQTAQHQQQQQQYQQQYYQQQNAQEQLKPEESGGFITRIKKILDPLLKTGTEAVHEEGQEGQQSAAPFQGDVVNPPPLAAHPHPQPQQGNVSHIPDNIAQPAAQPPPSFTDEQLQWLAGQLERGNLPLPDNRLHQVQPPQFQFQGNPPPPPPEVVPQCQENVPPPPPPQYHHQGNILPLPLPLHPGGPNPALAPPAFTDEQVQWIASQFRHGKLPACATGPNVKWNFSP